MCSLYGSTVLAIEPYEKFNYLNSKPLLISTTITTNSNLFFPISVNGIPSFQLRKPKTLKVILDLMYFQQIFLNLLSKITQKSNQVSPGGLL
jgi:hypothetical protein